MFPHSLGYAFTVLSLVLSLGLFLALRRELSTRQRRAKETWHELESRLVRLQAEVEELRRECAFAAAPPMPRSGLNLHKRSLALRLHRRGDLPPQIATALGIPINEVELLVKLQAFVLNPPAKPPQ